MELGDVSLSRILFAFTALYHFLFVPLTIGLAALVTLFEGIALRTGASMWHRAARFWGWFFVVNFMCGVLTGYPLRWQLEAHWVAYGTLVQDVVNTVFEFEGRLFPVLLAIVAVFALGWRLPPVIHFGVSCALAVALVLQSSAILALNAWMQYPVGTTMLDGRAELPGLLALFGNPLLAPKILHQVASAYTLAGMLVLAVSAWYLLRGRHAVMARGSFRVASIFTLAALGMTGVAGHWSGMTLVQYQPVKFAAIEAIWKTADARDFVLFAVPDTVSRSNRHEIVIPGLLGVVAGDADRPIRGLDTLIADTAASIRRDLAATQAQTLKSGKPVAPIGAAGLLPPGISGTNVSEAQIAAAAQHAIPSVPIVFWAFRVMLAAWGALMLVSLLAVWRGPDARSAQGRLLLWACLLALPLPWVATEAGWVVCEVGRQPWTVTGVLPTFRSGTALVAGHTGLKLLAVSLVYSGLFVLNIALSLRHLQRGPRPLPVRPDWAGRARPLLTRALGLARRLARAATPC